MLYNTRQTIVTVATRTELDNKHYYRRLWMAARNLTLPGEKEVLLPRRKWLDELAETFRDYRGIIAYPSGERFKLPEIDEVFGDDPDVRWLSYYFQCDATGQNPYAISRKMDRVQLIDLYFRIKFPDIAYHFRR